MKSTNALKSILAFIFLTTSYLVINACLSYANYNLYTDGKWDSSKTTLKKGLPGAWSLMFTNTALKGGELNLNALGGYQELIVKHPIPVKKIEFSYRSSGKPFSLIINKSDTLTTGIFFFPHDEPKAILYTAGSKGNFLSKKTFPMPLIPNSTNSFGEAFLFNDSIRIVIDTTIVGFFACMLPAEIKPGFRGSSFINNVYIDKIRITAPDDRIVFEDNLSFSFHLYKWPTLYFVFGLLFLSCTFYYDRLSLFGVYSVAVLSLAIIGFGYYYYYILDTYSQDPATVDWHGVKSTIEDQSAVEKRLDIQYPVHSIEKKKVILFIGSSQTWGAGASDTKNTFAAMVEASLRKCLNDTDIVVINAGISGTTSQVMYPLYVKKLLQYHPILTVVNISNNDTDTIAFRKNVQAFATCGRQQGIETIFIEEPNDGVIVPGAKHVIMRSVASGNGLTSVEMQPYLESHYEDGFVWWDSIHLSDFGQLLFANRISPIIADLLRKKHILNPAKAQQ